jgi:hypothetical protein
MRLVTLLLSFVLAAVALAGVVPAPKPQARTNAEALARGLPLKKPRICDAECKANRLARRAKPSYTSIPAVSVQFRKTCDPVGYNFIGGAAYMYAVCKDSAGVDHVTNLQLNDCISHNKGELHQRCADGRHPHLRAGGVHHHRGVH